MLNASGYIVAQRKAAVASKVTGRLVALMVEILSGLKAGDRFVVTPPKGLKDGSRIKVAER